MSKPKDSEIWMNGVIPPRLHCDNGEESINSRMFEDIITRFFGRKSGQSEVLLSKSKLPSRAELRCRASFFEGPSGLLIDNAKAGKGVRNET